MNQKTLVLLIGTSPLPNYVVAEYLLPRKEENYKKLVLIHSDISNNQGSTIEYAKKLIEVFSETLSKSEIQHELISLKEISSKETIEENIRNSGKFSYDEFIHLNYTGGTKTMAVHIYNYLKEKYINKIEFSYLDARDDRLIFDENDQRPTSDIAKNTTITLKELIDIHCYNFHNPLDNSDYKYIPPQNCYIEFEDILKRMDYNLNKLEYKRVSLFSKGIDNNIKELFKMIGGKDNDEAYKAYLEYRKTTHFSNKQNNDIASNLKYLSIDESNLPSTSILHKKKIHPSIDYFKNNKFFEHLCFIALEKAINGYNISNLNNKITEYGTSIEIKKQNADETNFEIDLYFIKGVRFYGISCTTDSDIKTLKSKGFEIILRARQLAGKEARSIIIYKKPDEPSESSSEKKKETHKHTKNRIEQLEKELAQDTGSSQNHFNMFPFTNIETLKEDFLLNVLNKN